MKAKYKNSLRSKKLIMDAVIHLFIIKKDLNLISITDICKYTGLNRGTFYNHYNNIMDVINDIENSVVIDIWNLWPTNVELEDKSEVFFQRLAEYIGSKESDLRVMAENTPVYLIETQKEKIIKKVEDYCLKNGVLINFDKTYIRFIVNGFMISLLDYLRKESDINLDCVLENAKTIINLLLKYKKT